MTTSCTDLLEALWDKASPLPWHIEEYYPGHCCVRREETGIIFCADALDNAADIHLAVLAVNHFAACVKALEGADAALRWTYGEWDWPVEDTVLARKKARRALAAVRKDLEAALEVT